MSGSGTPNSGLDTPISWEVLVSALHADQHYTSGEDSTSPPRSKAHRVRKRSACPQTASGRTPLQTAGVPSPQASASAGGTPGPSMGKPRGTRIGAPPGRRRPNRATRSSSPARSERPGLTMAAVTWMPRSNSTQLREATARLPCPSPLPLPPSQPAVRAKGNPSVRETRLLVKLPSAETQFKT